MTSYFVENFVRILTSCNCQDKNRCPLIGNCRMKNLIYKCTSLIESNVKKVYLGFSKGEFKKNSYYNPQQLFQNENCKKSTTLLAFLWSIKSKEQNVNLKWEIMRQATPYSNISKRYLLYLHEKLAIALYWSPELLLNERSEMISNIAI